MSMLNENLNTNLILRKIWKDGSIFGSLNMYTKACKFVVNEKFQINYFINHVANGEVRFVNWIPGN